MNHTIILTPEQFKILCLLFIAGQKVQERELDCDLKANAIVDDINVILYNNELTST